MAIIDSRGLVDDGSPNLNVVGSTNLASLNVASAITSSAGSFGIMSTVSAFSGGINLGSPGTFSLVQWQTGSAISSGVTPVSGTTLGVNQQGWYYTSTTLSFSGSAGVYTASLFVNGIKHANCQRQATISNGQSYPTGMAMVDLNYYNVGDQLDIRVSSNNGGANFQLGNGNFIIVRVTG